MSVQKFLKNKYFKDKKNVWDKKQTNKQKPRVSWF